MIGKIKNIFNGVINSGNFGSEINKFNQSCSRFNDLVSQILKAEDESRERIKILSKQVLDLTITQRLASTAIAELVRFGARIQPLLNDGFSTLKDIEGYTAKSLQSINGIGPSTANGIINAYVELKIHVINTTFLRLDPDKLSTEEVKLVEEVARYEKIKQNLNEVITQINEKKQNLEPSIDWIRTHSSEKFVNFDAEKQNQIIDYVSTVAPFVERAITFSNREFNQVIDLPRAGPDNPINRFKSNSAWFFSLLETVAPIKRAKTNPPPINIPNETGSTVREGMSNYAGFKTPASRETLSGNYSGKRNNTTHPPYPRSEPDRIPNDGVISDDGVHGELPLEIAQLAESVVLDLSLLKATLRRYQLFGAQYIIAQKKTLLGDDMGLGKTMQVLAAMCHLSANGKTHFMVVVPKSVLVNWEREVAKHTKLKSYILYGIDTYRNLDRWKELGGVAITTYESSSKIAPYASKIDFIAIDEAHMIKNPKAKKTITAKRLCYNTEFIVLMSGTALENRISELYHLILIANPSMRETAAYFIGSYKPLPLEVRRRLAPVYLRRTQSDVLVELPDLTKIDEIVAPIPGEINPVLANADDYMNRRLALTIGMGDQKSAKYDRLRELLDTYREEGRKVVIFSFFTKVVEDVSAIAGGCPILDGSKSSDERMRIIDQLGSKDGFSVIALQITAGGLGLNIQAAQVVILMEPQLKPSTESQAIARVYRMGQSRNVMVHRLIAEDSIDEDMVRLIAKKQQIFDDYAHHSSVKENSEMAMDSSSVEKSIKEETLRLDEERRQRRASSAN
jgi:SNF2 family DNA or RNA helicase